MPISGELGPALLAGSLWALSAPVISAALARARASRLPAVLIVACGLYVALLAGFVTIWVASGFASPVQELNLAVVLGGLFTFPLGTGLYYLCAAAFADRAAVASQFSNVKPLFSILAGVLIFGEPLTWDGVLAAALIVTGVGVMLAGTLARRIDATPIAIGLALAICWSCGEAFVRAATGGASTLHITLGALFWSILVTTPVVGILLFSRGGGAVLRKPGLAPVLLPFALHGVLSFGAAYYFFFHSIGAIGLSRTVMITVAWPALALLIDVGLRAARRQPIDLRPTTIAGMALFTLAAVLHVLPFGQAA